MPTNPRPYLSFISRRAAMALFAMATLSVLSVNLVETVMGVIRPLDRFGFPAQALLFMGLLVAVKLAWIEPLPAVRLGTLCFGGYQAASISAGWIWPGLGTVDAYTIGTLSPWLLLLVILLFVAYPRRHALAWALGCLATIQLPPLAAWLGGWPAAGLARALSPYLMNMVLVYLTCTGIAYWLSSQVGRLLQLGAELAPARAGGGPPDGIDEMIRQRTQALTALLDAVRTREAELRSMLEAFPGVVACVEADGRYSYVNRRFADLVGREPAQIVGMDVRELLGPAEADALQSRRAQLRTHREPVRFEQSLGGMGDTPRELLVTHFSVPRPDGQGERDYEIGIDITERRQAERAQAEAVQAAERANRAKSEFLSRMSHELRTPLNAVLGLAQLLHADLAPHEHQALQHLRAIEQAARHLTALIGDAVDWTHIESGRMRLQQQALDLVRVATDARDTLAGLAAGHRVRLRVAEAAAPVLAWGDPLRVRQVVLNLAGNAIKYNRAGGEVELAAGLEGDRACLTVRDDGPGLTAEQQTRLFEPYERLGAEHGPIAGTGLGLSIAQRLAVLMDGTITLQSQPGQGCLFTLRLHAAAPGTAAPVVPTEPPSTDAAVLRILRTGQPRSVLYVEDNEVNRMVFAACMARRPDWQVRMAERAADGLAQASAEPPDLVVLDLHLPDMGGLELARRLRALPRLADTRIALLTADASPEARALAEAGGVHLVWHKPIDAAHLLSDIDAMFPAAVAGNAPA